MFYALLALPVIIGLAVYAVDIGRVVLAQDELQTAADAAARYAAIGVVTSTNKSATAYSQAVAVCNDLRADGRAITLSSADVQVGIWNDQTRTFTANASSSSANAVRVTVRQTLGESGSVPLIAQMLGGSSQTITRSSVAYALVTETEVVSPSQGNLWLAGMPDNTHITNLQGNATRYDNSGNNGNRKQRPEEVSLTDLGLEPGDVVSFEGLSGVGSNGGGSGNTGPDGQTSRVPVTLGNANANMIPNNSVNGIANVRAPLAACMAVFLGEAAPDTTPAPSCLDFGLHTQRDYLNIEPEVKQPFFVGDGKTSWGEVQYIRIPDGATRIYLGMMDAWQWNDNTGNFRLKFYRGRTVTTVK